MPSYPPTPTRPAGHALSTSLFGGGACGRHLEPPGPHQLLVQLLDGHGQALLGLVLVQRHEDEVVHHVVPVRRVREQQPEEVRERVHEVRQVAVVRQRLAAVTRDVPGIGVAPVVRDAEVAPGGVVVEQLLGLHVPLLLDVEPQPRDHHQRRDDQHRGHGKEHPHQRPLQELEHGRGEEVVVRHGHLRHTEGVAAGGP